VVSDRRSALLGAALDEIASRGTRGMRVEEVATRAGVSPALIYHYFVDRSGLLAAALVHVGERADAYTARSVPERGPGRARLTAVLLAEIQDDPEVRINSAAWGELRDAAIFDESLRPTIAGLTESWVDDLAMLVRTGQADGSIDAARSPKDLGVRLSVAVEGLSSRWLCGILTTRQARAHLRGIIDELL